MKTFGCIILLLLFMCSCSLEKRHYRKGYFVDRSSKKHQRVRTYPVPIVRLREPVLTASTAAAQAAISNNNSNTRISNHRVYARHRKYLFVRRIHLHVGMPKFLRKNRRHSFIDKIHLNIQIPQFFKRNIKIVRRHQWRK